jgi:hypothetical protein
MRDEEAGTTAKLRGQGEAEEMKEELFSLKSYTFIPPPSSLKKNALPTLLSAGL